MLYNLANILDKERFKRRTNDLYKKGKVVDLTEKTNRSLPQNSYLHLICGWYALETGNTTEFVKEAYFKRLCNKELFVSEINDQYLGMIERIKSTKDCTKEEITMAIDRFRNWSSSECNIHLPSPDDRAFLQSIEVEMSKNKIYL